MHKRISVERHEDRVAELNVTIILWANAQANIFEAPDAIASTTEPAAVSVV